MKVAIKTLVPSGFSDYKFQKNKWTDSGHAKLSLITFQVNDYHLKNGPSRTIIEKYE